MRMTRWLSTACSSVGGIPKGASALFQQVARTDHQKRHLMWVKEWVCDWRALLSALEASPEGVWQVRLFVFYVGYRDRTAKTLDPTAEL
jgi:hypothetical protein